MELSLIENYRIIRFIDGNTFGDLEWTDRLLTAIIEARLHKEFIMDIRVDTAALHPEIIAKAAEAGLKVAIVGIESDNEQELSNYRKNLSPNLISKAIETFHRYGIMIRGNYIVRAGL